MANNANLKTNNEKLASILEIVNALPEASGGTCDSPWRELPIVTTFARDPDAVYTSGTFSIDINEYSDSSDILIIIKDIMFYNDSVVHYISINTNNGSITNATSSGTHAIITDGISYDDNIVYGGITADITSSIPMYKIIDIS